MHTDIVKSKLDSIFQFSSSKHGISFEYAWMLVRLENEIVWILICKKSSPGKSC